MSLSEKDLKNGDHVYVRRLLHSHHGIYTGEGRVIHFKGAWKEKSDPVVRETTLHDFLRGGRLRWRDYKERSPREETVRLARQLLNGKNYSLIRSNCEHMATYCATGKASSRQVQSGTIGLVCAGVVGVVTVTWDLLGKKRRN